MSPWKHLTGLVATSLLVLSGCGGSSGTSNVILTVTQDLDLDPTGRTTVVTFEAELPTTLLPAFFEADAGQSATGVVLDGVAATVTWDDRVTPSHEVRVTGFQGIADAFAAVSTTDSLPPTFAVVDSTQVAGLGGDTVTVGFSGAYVVPELAQDLANWMLIINDEAMDLTGSTAVFDELSQTVEITFGTQANLWASFELAASGLTSVADVPLGTAPVEGTATDDVGAPSLLAAEQNLEVDEFGRVIDFQFDEAMDPVFAAMLSNFDAGFPVLASTVEQVAEDTLRVRFTNPVIPGVDQVTLQNMFDAHGNLATGGLTAVEPGAFVIPNGYTVEPVVRAVENEGGDLVVIETDLALEPLSAVTHINWSLEIDGTPITMLDQEYDYDFLARTLTIELVDDWPFDAVFTLTPLGPLQVDGGEFTTPFTGTVTGDEDSPVVESVVQNRTVDPTGATIDVTFSEDLDPAEANDESNWSVTGRTVLTAALQGAGDIVRLTLDGLAVPGDVVVGVAQADDLAGNSLLGLTGLPLTSTDLAKPNFSGVTANGIEGAENDYVVVRFDDDMIKSEVEDPLNWFFETPIGTPIDPSAAFINYRTDLREARLTFNGGDGISLQVEDDFSLSLTGMRDLGGNVVDSAARTGENQVELGLPTTLVAWVQDFLPGFENRVHVRFSEPMSNLDDISGQTRYRIWNGTSNLGPPTSVDLDADLMGAVLVYDFAVSPGVHTLDVRGTTDVAGNQAFPVEGMAIESEDPDPPGLDAGTSTAVTLSGEDNDTLTVVFDRPMSPWRILDPALYTFEGGGDELTLGVATFEFDGDRTVTIRLDGGDPVNVRTGASYTLSTEDLTSAQGEPIDGTSSDTVVAGGDVTPPAFQVGRVRLDPADAENSVLIEVNEAVDLEDAIDASLVEIGGSEADGVTRLGYRTIRATWAGGVSVSEVVDVAYRDLAGNVGAISQAVVGADAAGPLLASVSGTIAPGLGGDRIQVAFNEPVDGGSALLYTNYDVTQNFVPVELSNATLTYDSGSMTVTLELPAGTELVAGVDIDVSVSGVRDHSLNLMTPGFLPGSVTGDDTPPTFLDSFVNLRKDPAGTTVDVLLSEDVEFFHLISLGNWTVSGGQHAVQGDFISDRLFRVRFNSPIGASDVVSLAAGLQDVAGNVAPDPIASTPKH